MNVAKAIKAQTPEIWHEVGRDFRDTNMVAYLVCTDTNEICVYPYFCPPGCYVLGGKFPKSVMAISKKLPKDVRKILEQYFPLDAPTIHRHVE